MALSVLPSQLVVTIQDGKEKTSTVSCKLEIGRDLSFNDLDEAGRDFQNLLDALITGEIIGCNAVVPLTLHGSLDAVDANSDVEEAAIFVFGTSGGNFTARMTIPTFDESKFVASTQLVDLADGAVDSFVDTIIAGLDDAGLSDPIDVVDSHGVGLTQLLSANGIFTKNRK